MSITQPCHCIIPGCIRNQKTIHADAQQIKKHYWTHSYRNLLKTAKSLKLIEEYARPKGRELVDILANRSLIRSSKN